jgi:competence ComEA-like helix-hairpin-helix protein
MRFLLVWLVLTAAAAAGDLEKFTAVRLVENPFNDGDSFVVEAGNRRLHLRLYFVDCPESVATTDADAKRVREQARYFGITDTRKVFEYGRAAKQFTAAALAEPFTIYTAFAGAMGRSPGGRVYAFVFTHNGQDLAHLLVSNGLARAYGAKRAGPNGETSQAIAKALQQLELDAMHARRGAWAASDPKEIERLRALQRADDQELKEILRESAGKDVAPASVDLNTATTSELQAISGIGPKLAAAIIAGRPYRKVEDVLRVSGMGPKLFERVKPYLIVRERPEE